MSASSPVAASAFPSKAIIKIAPALRPKSLILDAPCGFGRNSFYLAERGHHVVCVDHDTARLSYVKKARRASKNLHVVNCDLNARGLPFPEGGFDALLIVHFIPAYWDELLVLLRPGGLLFVETMGGQGGNYLELPRAGVDLRHRLDSTFGSGEANRFHRGLLLGGGVHHEHGAWRLAPGHLPGTLYAVFKVCHDSMEQGCGLTLIFRFE